MYLDKNVLQLKKHKREKKNACTICAQESENPLFDEMFLTCVLYHVCSTYFSWHEFVCETK